MVKYTYEKLIDIIERHGFYFEHHKDNYKGNYALLEQSTPLDEDWCIEIDYSNIGDLINQLIEYADDYDVDEEAAIYIECRGKRGVPESITDLIEDSRWKKEVLLNLSNELQGKKSKKMKKLWLRIGAEIELPDDIDVSDNSRGILKDIIYEKISNGEFRVCGETYAPYFENNRYENQKLTGSEPEVVVLMDE